jgi:hypothetical protein
MMSHSSRLVAVDSSTYVAMRQRVAWQWTHAACKLHLLLPLSGLRP